MSRKVELRGEAEKDRVEIEVFLRGGGRLRVEGLEGETLSPILEKSIAKFERLASDFLGEETPRVLEAVLGMGKMKNIRGLTDLLRASRPRSG